MKLIKFDNENKYIKDFLRFPKTIYFRNCTQNDAEIKTLLLNAHPLSQNFELHKFLVYDENFVVGRFAVTFYKDDKQAYIGLYECIDDDKTAKFIFENAVEFAKENGKETLVGPVDCSFWINYRLKTNMFDKPTYTGEPYNMPYYKKQFTDNCFSIAERYTSNVYEYIGQDYVNDKFEERYKLFSEQGYEIKNLEIDRFDEMLTEVYYLLTDLYSDFPIYKDISLQTFLKMFSYYRKVIVPEMVKFAFYQGKMVGFLISVPDYQNLTSNITPLKLLKILKIRKYPQKFIMLYMGVDRNHKGLGKALAYAALKELKSRNASGIGALTKEGKVTQNYAEDIIEDRYEYVLFRREI